ncbi:MAG: CDP-alcohol phosphatidyltransferase family protein [archaeon]|nr:CDP-alcohol phosphatidyltransferase family protein [archaeon]
MRIPDLLSLLRVMMSLVLLFLVPLSDGFLFVYTLCCLTDVLDGRIARFQDDLSPTGQTLDSICDAVLAVILLICIIPGLPWEDWMILWIAGIAAIRLVGLGVGSGRHGRPAFVHTYLNKLSGFLLFLTPFLLRIVDLPTLVVVVCSITTVSAIEYLYINCTSSTLDQDCPGLFFRHH